MLKTEQRKQINKQKTYPQKQAEEESKKERMYKNKNKPKITGEDLYMA